MALQEETAVVTEEERHLHLFQVQEHPIHRGKWVVLLIMGSQDSLKGKATWTADLFILSTLLVLYRQHTDRLPDRQVDIYISDKIVTQETVSSVQDVLQQF